MAQQLIEEAYLIVASDEGNVLFARKKWQYLSKSGIKKLFNGAGQYVFPGGHIEQGEHPQAAAIREFYEEVGVGIDVGTGVLHDISTGEYGCYVFVLVKPLFDTLISNAEAFVNSNKSYELQHVYSDTWFNLKNYIGKRQFNSAIKGYASVQNTPAQSLDWYVGMVQVLDENWHTFFPNATPPQKKPDPQPTPYTWWKK